MIAGFVVGIASAVLTVAATTNQAVASAPGPAVDVSIYYPETARKMAAKSSQSPQRAMTVIGKLQPANLTPAVVSN
jgi:hypothetical protein